MGKMIPISVAVSDELLVKIDRFAEDRGLDRSGVLHLALSELIAEQAAMDAFVQAGIDSFEQEGSLSREEVEAWLAERRNQRAAAE